MGTFEIARKLDFENVGFPAEHGYQMTIDNELAHIPGCDSERLVSIRILVAQVNLGGTAAMYAIYSNGASEMLATASNFDLFDACRMVCFNAATNDFFLRLHELEKNPEDAVNHLAYDALALWNNSDDLRCGFDSDDLDFFLGRAREYVRENGPAYGIEWVEY